MKSLTETLANGGERVTDNFVELFRANCTKMVRLAALLGADDPEDIAQEAFARVFRTWASIRGDDPTPYLQRTLANLVRSRQRRLLTAWRRQQPGPIEIESAEELVVVREEHREVVAAVRRLPRRQREAIVLRYWLDLPYAQIAEVMGISAGAIKGYLSRGLKALEETSVEER
ncbi:SigE family RNA polymerase sigma factor [Flindersiella endophytica]